MPNHLHVGLLQMAIDVIRVSEPGALAKELPKIFVGSLHHVLASCKALASGSCIRNAPGIRVLTGRCTFDIDIGLEDLHCDRSWADWCSKSLVQTKSFSWAHLFYYRK